MNTVIIGKRGLANKPEQGIPGVTNETADTSRDKRQNRPLQADS